MLELSKMLAKYLGKQGYVFTTRDCQRWFNGESDPPVHIRRALNDFALVLPDEIHKQMYAEVTAGNSVSRLVQSMLETRRRKQGGAEKGVKRVFGLTATEADWAHLEKVAHSLGFPSVTVFFNAYLHELVGLFRARKAKMVEDLEAIAMGSFGVRNEITTLASALDELKELRWAMKRRRHNKISSSILTTKRNIPTKGRKSKANT